MTTTTTWRRTCAVALVAAPALGLVLDRLDAWVLPDDGGDGPRELVAQLNRIHAHDLLWQVDAVLALVWGLTLVVATLGLVRLTRPGAPRLTAATTLVLLPGAVGTFAHGVFYNTVFGAMARVSEPASMAPFVDAMEAYPPFRVALVVVIAGTVVGLALACLALWRSRVVPAWVAALATVYPLVELLSLDGWWPFAGLLCWLLAWIVVARAVWRSGRPRSASRPGATSPAGSRRVTTT